jgi:hypothetical protein
VFEDWALRGIFTLQKEQITKLLKSLRGEKRHDWHSSYNVAVVIGSRAMGYLGNTAREGMLSAEKF